VLLARCGCICAASSTTIIKKNFGALKAADGVYCNFLRVHHRGRIERVKQGGADEEILQWCFEKGRRLNEGDLFVWNGFASKLGWRDSITPRLEERKKQMGIADRNDIHSRPYRFRREPIPGGEQDFVSSSNSTWLRIVGVAIGLCSLAFTACQYDVPITSSPTRKVQEQLLGDWRSTDGKEEMKLRSLDDSVYIVYYDGDLFRAYHSDVAETRFASVQDLNSSDRKYAYVVWKLSDDGKNLRLRSVNDKVVPKETRDPATVVALLTKNARNPELFGEEIEFRKEK
jgi:hypothetical protein